MIMQKFFLGLTILLFTSGCLQDPKIVPLSLSSPEEIQALPVEALSSARLATVNRITYGSASNRQHLDFYSADGNLSTKPFILMVHGGAWVLGPTTSTYESIFKPLTDLPMKNLVLNLVNKGYACGVMKYRLPKYNKMDTTPTSVPYAQSGMAAIMNDINDAIGAVVAQAGALKVDPNRMGIMGESAGGYFALMYAYGNLSNQHYIQTAISFYAPIDLSKPDAAQNNYTYAYNGKVPKLFNVPNSSSFQMDDPATSDEDTNSNNTSLYILRAFDSLIGAYYPTQVAAQRHDYSVTGLASNPTTLPRTLALHGLSDALVNPNQVDLLKTALGAKTYTAILAKNDLSARHLFMKINGFGHGWVPNFPIGLSLQFDQNIYPKIITWLEARLKVDLN